MACREELLEGLPMLIKEEKTVLDCDLSLGEPATAGEQLAPVKAPGIDGF